MPLSIYGDGLKKDLLLAASIILAKDGILLIDEIETAIHVSALEKDIRMVLKNFILYFISDTGIQI